eukprot:11341660-Alexandrium_andersonii.AAC.1
MCQLEPGPLAKASVTHRASHTTRHIIVAGPGCKASRGIPLAHMCAQQRGRCGGWGWGWCFEAMSRDTGLGVH